MVLWSKEQDKLPDINMSSGNIEMKKEGGPLTPAFLNSNSSVHPVILTKGSEEVSPGTGGDFELTEVASFTDRANETREDEERMEIVVAMDCRANAKGQREEDALLENASQSNESDDTSNDQSPEPPPPLKETSFSIGLQVVFPFLLAGFGTVAAGMVLDIVQVSHMLHSWTQKHQNGDRRRSVSVVFTCFHHLQTFNPLILPSSGNQPNRNPTHWLTSDRI